MDGGKVARRFVPVFALQTSQRLDSVKLDFESGDLPVGDGAFRRREWEIAPGPVENT
jgi:hypothetical protein